MLPPLGCSAVSPGSPGHVRLETPGFHDLHVTSQRHVDWIQACASVPGFLRLHIFKQHAGTREILTPKGLSHPCPFHCAWFCSYFNMNRLH